MLSWRPVAVQADDQMWRLGGQQRPAEHWNSQALQEYGKVMVTSAKLKYGRYETLLVTVEISNTVASTDQGSGLEDVYILDMLLSLLGTWYHQWVSVIKLHIPHPIL